MKTTITQIADYWIEHSDISECILNFDWADAHHHCWNCGDDKQSSTGKVRLERCHIIPKALDGEDTPSNYVLLCKGCHKEAPDSIHPEYMWEWIKSNRTKSGMYGTYKLEKAMELFEQRKGYSVYTIASKGIPNDIIMEQFKETFEEVNTHGFELAIESIYTTLCELEKRVDKLVAISNTQ